MLKMVLLSYFYTFLILIIRISDEYFIKKII